MSTTDPIGDGGGGGTSTTNVDSNVTPITPSTGIAVPPGSHHQQHPPPSPLSGCYLLVVLPEPHTAQHRDLILNRLAKGFLSWDKDSCHVDLEKELQALVAQAPEGEEARNGERLIQYATENLVTEVLIHPQTNTLLQCIRNLLASFTKHRHIIHAGYTFGGNGSWILQDGTFSLADFLDAFSEHEVQRVLRAYENSVTVDINCAGVGEWSTSRLSKEACTRSCRVRLNPDDVLTAGVPAITSFTTYVGQYLVPQTLDQLMEPSDVVGNIRFSHPTLYVFPGGQGDAALFGINGFNMLVDGGFARKACFWDFARHLDRLDAVLVTRINNSNVGGMSSVLQKKKEMHVYPQIGHFFCNLVERRHSNSPDGDKDLDPLILNLTDIGQEMMVNLRQINLRAHPCYRDPNPINLYHKVGHGTLDMYVLSPNKDSREVKEFLAKWHASDSKLFAGSHRKDPNILTFPIQNLASICALLVWQPANPEDTITRILFPGSTPQHKIFEGFERLKHLDFLKHPVCTAKSLSPSTSLLALKDRPIKQKLGLIEKEPKKAFDIKKEKRDLPESKLSKAAEEISKPQATPIIPISKPQPAKVDVKSKKVVENKKIEIESKESKRIEKDLKEMKKDVKKDISKIDKESEMKKIDGMKIKTDSEKSALIKESKSKPEPKKKEAREPKPVKLTKTEAAVKSTPKILDKKPKPTADRKESAKASPPTPKKTMNGSATKVELAKTTPKPISKPTSKQPLSTMPAKSAKDANNRKVLEQKNIEIASAAGAAAASPATAKLIAKPKAPERKPISRRTKPVSPSKARVPGSPAKSTRSTPTTSVKSDKDGVIRKVKGDRGTTDSSTVSTPSGIEIDSMMKLADKSLAEKSEDMSLDSIESKVLADLKEEREVVEEIEAVLQKAERIEEARKDDHLEGDDDITAEATDKKEDDLTEEDVTADMEEAPKKAASRKPSQELTEEDEYLIIEKEEIYIEDSAQSGEGEQKHILDAVESEKVKTSIDIDTAKEDEETEVSEEKEKSDIPEKKLVLEEKDKEKETDEMSPGHKEQLQEEMKDIIASATEIVQKAEDKDDSGKKDSEDITKEPSSLSPDKFDSSEKKTTDTDMKPEVDQKEPIPEKLEESQERMSTLESGATTTAPTLPEDERIPLDEIKEVVDEKYISEEVKEKDTVEPVKESFVAPLPTEPKPETKPFEVRPPLSGVQRDIVKTPDEVADLPVHEEVDPKLYRMEDFEKAKDEKQAPPETKEPPTPPVKEQKGVFSFFGKVADKFEKGIDKLTGKSRRDSEKDIDEKSSSKSSSPKEARPQELTFPREAQVNELSIKIDKIPEVADTFEKGELEASKVKLAAIKDTAAFLHGEIEDAKKTTVADQEPEESKDIEHDKIPSDQPEIKTLPQTKAAEITEPIFQTCVLKGEKDKVMSSMADTRVEDAVEDDVEEVEALLEEASKKFKTVKDSLRDSLESLEDKIVEEEMVRAELAAASKDVVKDTLSEVVGKLEEITPYTEVISPDTKEPEKVKFDIPKSEEFEDEEEDDFAGPTKDFKEAVRDVGEVLAGSAGILIEEKPKDVIEIVKKVAEVLKKDDFLSHDVLFEKSVKAEDKISDATTEAEKSIPHTPLEVEDTLVKPTIEGTIIPKKVGITEELPPQEEIEEMLESGIVKPLLTYKPPDGLEVQEEPCTKTLTDKGSEVTSPVRDPELEKADAKKICADLMKDELTQSRPKRSLLKEDDTMTDVMDAGIEDVCVKEEVKHQTSREDEQDQDIEVPVIAFDRKVSPTKAELVMVTPDSAPTSPKFPTEKMQTKEVDATLEAVDETFELPAEIREALEKEGSLEKIIEDLVFTKKKKITIEIVEYITVIRKIPREKVIYIIEEIIIKKRVPRDSVVADLDLLRPDTVSPDKRLEIEQYIEQEYIKKNKRITIEIVEEISVQKFVTKRIVIEIIEEIIVKKKIPRDSVLDITEKQFSQIGVHRKDSIVTEEQDATKDDETVDIDSLSAEKHADIEKYIVDELISKGKKITAHIVDDVCVAKKIPRHIFIHIIEEIIIKRKIPRSSILDISEKELSEMVATEKEDIREDEPITDLKTKDDAQESELKEIHSISPEKRQEIENNINDEYVTKGRRITPYIFEDISARYRVSRHIIIEIIEDIVVKHKLRRESVINISDIELVELLEIEKQEDEQETAEAASDEQKDDVPDSEVEGIEAATLQSESEIEKYITEEFLTKGRKIKPYIFEDICVQYKVPRRIVIEIIELIIVKRNIPRTAILDITETELSQLLAAVEAEGDESNEVDVQPICQKALSPEEDKIIDGFVSIPSKDEKSPEKDVSLVLSKAVELAEPAFKESEKDVADDFEAVEQEYKIQGSPITPVKKPTSVLSTAKEDDKHSTQDIDEAVEDDVSDVIEAEEKVIITAAKTEIDKKFEDVSESSEIIDTTEKYLIEAQEKTDPKKQDVIQSLDTLVDETKRIEPKAEEVSTAAIKAKELKSSETVSSKDDKDYTVAEQSKAEATSEIAKAVTPEIIKDIEKTIQTKVETVVDDKVSKEGKHESEPARERDASPTKPTEIRKPSIVELKEELEEIKLEQLKSKEHLSTSQDKEQRKDSLTIEQGEESDSVVEKLSSKDEVESNVDVEESTTATGTVRRMVVTASSEDGGQETEVCPTGTITFKKAGSPDDSLKTSSVKSTPDQDSLLLDKESVHSGASTPEKDSISGKSTPGTKTGDKITPEDSLDKSPLRTRGSQDLEDSLDKSDLVKLKEVVTTKPSTEQKEDVVPLKPDTTYEEVPVSIASDDTALFKEAIEKTLPVKQEDSPKTIDATADVEKSIPKTELIEGLTTKPVISGITHAMLDEEDQKFDKPRSLSIASLKDTEKEPKVVDDTAIDKSFSPDAIDKVTSTIIKETRSMFDRDLSAEDTSTSGQIDDIKEPKIGLEKLSTIPTTEHQDEVISPTKSPSPSLHEEPIDRTKSQSRASIDKIISDGDKVEPELSADKSKSPSPERETTQDLKIEDKALDRSRSASISSDKHSIVDEKLSAPDTQDSVDNLRSPSLISEKLDDKVPIDRSKSPSIEAEKHDDLSYTKMSEKSRSPSIHSEERDETLPSIVGDVQKEAADLAPKPQSDSITKFDKIVVADHDIVHEEKKSPTVIDEEDAAKDAIDLAEKSRSPSFSSDKLQAKAIVEDQDLGAALAEKKPLDRSRSSSIASETHIEKDVKEAIDKSKSPTIVSEKVDDRLLLDSFRPSSVASDLHSEKDSTEIVEKESFDRTASASIVDDKIIGSDLTVDKSRSPSLVSGKASTDGSKSPSVADDEHSEKEQDEKSELGHLKSPGIISDKLVDGSFIETVDKSRTPSLVSATIDDKDSIDPSRSPSIVGEKLRDGDLRGSDDKSRRSTLVDETVVDHLLVDPSKSPSIVSDQQKSRTSSIGDELVDETASILRSPSLSIAEKIADKDSKDSADTSKSPSLIGEKVDITQSDYRSKSPSVADDKLSEKDTTEFDKSRSPSIASEKPDVKEVDDPSRSASVVGDKLTVEDLAEPIDKPRTPSIATEKLDDTELVDRSKSPSIIDDKQSEKDAPVSVGKSRSPSITSEKPDDHGIIDRSKSPSIADDKWSEKDVTEHIDKSKSPSIASEKPEDKDFADRSKTSSLAGDKLSEKEVMELIDKSRSSSIASERPDDKTPDHSAPLGISDDKQSEKHPIQRVDKSRSPSIVDAELDVKASVDRPKSPSIASDKQSEKDVTEPIDKSRTPSISSEKPDDKGPIDRSKSPSIADDKLSEKDVAEPIEKSRSPSITSEKLEDKKSVGDDKVSEKDVAESIEKSRTSSISSDKPDDKEVVDRSKSPSIIDDKHSTKDSAESVDKSRSPSIASEKPDDRGLIDRSKSPSIADDKLSEKDAGKQIDKSRSPSVASEKLDDKGLDDGDKLSEKDVTEPIDKSRKFSISSEKPDEKGPDDRSKSPSIIDDKHSAKDSAESIDKSRSPSVASEKPDDRGLIDRSKSPSIADDKLSEKDLQEVIEKSRSPSITSEKLDDKRPVDGVEVSEKDVPEPIEKSRTSSISSEKLDAKESIDRSKSPSIIDDKHSTKDSAESVEKSRSPSIASEKPDDRELIDCSKSPSIADDKLSEKDVGKPMEKSRSPSITSEKLDDKKPVDGDKVSEKDVVEPFEKSETSSISGEKLDDKGPVDRSKSPSIIDDKHSVKDSAESVDKSRSPSIASEKPDDRGLIDRSKSPSIADDKLSEKDLQEAIEKSRSPSISSDKLDDKRPVDGVKDSEKDVPEPIEKSRTSSISSEKPFDKGPDDRSKSPSITDEKYSTKDFAESVDKSRSPSIASDKPDDRGLIDRSKSPSIADDKLSEKDVGKPMEKSRSPSITSDKLDGKGSDDGDKLSEKDVAEPIDKSRKLSIASEKPFDKGPDDRSKSPSIIDEKDTTKDSAGSVDKSRSPSIASEKPDDRGLMDRSKWPSIADDKLSEKDVGKPMDKSRSPSITSEKLDDKKPVDGDKVSEKDVAELIEKSRTSSMSSEKLDDKGPVDRSKSPSIIDDKHTTKDSVESVDKSRSPSIASEKPDDRGLIDRSKSPSIADDKLSEKDVGKPMEKSRSPSITSEKLDDKKSVDDDKVSEKDIAESIEKSRTPSISSDKPDDKGSIDRSKSPSIADDKLSEKDAGVAIEKSRSSSMISEKHDDKGPVDINKLSEKDIIEPIDKSRTPSISSEKPEDKGPVDRSISPSIIDDKHSEKDTTESADKSRSPSIPSEKPDDQGTFDRSKSPSIADDKHSAKDVEEPIEETRSPSITSEKLDDKGPDDGDKLSEKDIAEPIDKSRKLSISSEKPDEKRPDDRSKSPSIIDDKHSEKDATESIDKSRSPSIASEKPGEQGPTDRSKSPSIADDKHSEKDLEGRIEKSRSPSITSQKPDDKELTDETKPSSIADDKLSEKDVTETIDRSRTPSIASEKPVDSETADRSKSPSIVDDKHSEKSATELVGKSKSPSITSEKHDDLEPIDHSKSPSIADDKQSEKDITEGIEKSRSPSSEKLDDKEHTDHSKSSITSDDKLSEKDVAKPIDKSRTPSISSEKPDDRGFDDRSKSPSIIDDKYSEKDVTESIDKSRSPSITSEKPDDRETLHHSKPLSVSDDKQIEKDTSEQIHKSTSPSFTIEKLDDKKPIDGIKSPSIVGDRHDEKDATQAVDKSRSPSIASEQQDEKERADRSKSPSIAGDKQSEKDVAESMDKSRSSSIASEKLDDKKLVSSLTSPTISDDKQSKTQPMELDVKSRSPSISHVKLDENESDVHSKSPSIADGKDSEKDLSMSEDKMRSPTIDDKKLSDKESVGSAKSPTIIDDKHSESDVIGLIAKPTSPSTVSEKLDAVEQDLRMKAFDIAVDKHTTLDVTPPSEKSTSPSMAGDKQHSQEPIDLSKTSIVIGDQISKDIKVDKLKSPSSLIDQALDHKKPTGPSDAPQVIETVTDVTEKQEFVSPLSVDTKDKMGSSSVQKDKFELPVDSKNYVDETIDKSQSASIVSSHQIQEELTKFQMDSKSTDTHVHDSKLDEPEAVQALQKLAETMADKSTEIKHVSKSPTDGTAPHDTPRDRSRSHSLFDTGEKTPLGRSRTASLFDDKVPEGLSLLDEVKSAVQQSEYIYDEVDESKITKEGGSLEESLIPDGLSKRSSITIPEEIAGQLVEDSCTSIADVMKIKDYIVDKYIIKKEKITSQIVEDIAKIYSIPNSQIMKLIEFIIVKMNVPRDSIVNYPKDDKTCDSTVALKDDHVDVIDITLTKRQDIESYINDEFITKNKKISSKMVDELAHLKSVSRYVIITIIEEIITKKKLARTNFLEDGILDDSKPEEMRSVTMDSKRSSVASIASHGQTEHDGTQFEEDVTLPSISTDHMISPKGLVAESSVIHGDKESPISEQKRVEIESYIMEECVKKGTKITILVLEQIMTRMAVSKPILLDIIENIIITRKMSRKTMVDDAIYDDIESTTGKSTPELTTTKHRIVEFSGKSTPDPKSSGYSTPETRQYDDKFSKDIYSTDYESPFHKAFIGGMTEIRTTHITTLSGKSTPDFGTRGETPESLSDSITSSSQVRIEEKLPSGKISPLRATPDEITETVISQTTVEQASSISTSVTMATTATTISSALASASELKQSVSSYSDEAVSDELRKMVKREISDSKVELDETDRVTKVIPQGIDKEQEPVIVTKVIRKEVIDDEEPEVITKVIRKEVIDDEEPEVITKVIRKEVIDDEEPEVITKVIRKEIIEQGEPEIVTRIIRREIIDDGEEIEDDGIHDTVTRRISQGISPEIVETITTRTTKTIVTEDGPDYETSDIHTTTTRTGISSDAEDRHSPGKTSLESTDITKIVAQDTVTGGPISADVKRTVTTVTTVTEPDGKITTKKDVQESTDVLEGEKLLEKLIDSTITTDSSKVTDAKSIESLKTEKIITETIKTMTTTSGTSTPGVRTDFDSAKTTPDSVSRDEKSEALGKTHVEKIVAEKSEHPISPIIKDLISDERSYSGKSSPDVSLPKDIQFSGSTGKSTPEIPISPYARDGATGHPHMSGRSTPDKRPDSRSSTATPEGFRSGEVIRTIITTTRTMSEDGDIVTTTKEITETTNDKGETIILAEKTDVKVEDCIPVKDMSESIYGGGIQDTKGLADFQRTTGLGSDMPRDKDIGEVSPHSDHSSIHSRAGTHVWGSSEERHTYSDDEPPGSPLSTTSQVGYSPQSTYHFGEQSFGKDSSHKSMEFSEADMSSSFYGELPDMPPRATTMKTAYLECSEASGTSETGPTEGDFTFKKFTIEKEFAGGYSEKSGGKHYVDDADLDFEKALMERKEMKRDREHSTGVTSGYTNGSIAKASSSTLPDDSKDSKDDTKKDPLAGWGAPLGLPSPKPPRKFNLRTTARTSNSADISPDSLNFDVISDWGEPLRLPSPAPIADEASNKGAPATPKKERKQPKKVLSENLKNRKRSESPSKNEKKSKDAKNKIQPVYMDLTYVPHHGNSYYTSLEFFKKIRARYYVFSGTEPSREVYDALLDAKKTWEDKDLEVTMIPTYDTDTLGYWVADNEEALAANHIDLSPSASRCTINLQDHETSCSAYRLEF